MKVLLRAVVLTAAASMLTGCIQSTGPILSDSTRMFGPKLRLQLYGLRDGFARDPETVSFSWNGRVYAHSGGGMRDVSGFTVHPFEGGDVIIQTIPGKHSNPTEFAIAHKLLEGVWQVSVIDDADADEPARAAFCKKSSKANCQIETREQLFAFARATAAQRKDNGGLAIRLPDGVERKGPRRR